MDDRTVYAAPSARYLVVARGPGKGRMFLLLDGRRGVGRAPDNDVEVDAADVRASRHHALLHVEGGLVVVEDLGSANGTLLDGAPVSRAELRPGMELTVGETVFTLADPQTPVQDAPVAPDPSAPGPGARRVPVRALLYGAALLAALAVAGLLATGGEEKAGTQAPAVSSAPAAPAAPPAPAVPVAPAQPPASPEQAAAEASREAVRLGQFLYNSGQPRKAVDHWREALRLDPGNAQAARLLSRAEAELDQLVDKHYRQAQLALRYQRLDEARAELRQVVENSLDPRDERTRDSLRKLEELGGR